MTKLYFDKVSTDIINEYKPTDCGRYGDCFERNGKALIKGYRGNKYVSRKGAVDCFFKGWKLEFKINCGSFLGEIAKNDFMVYTYDGNNDWCEPWKAHVIPMSEFLKGLETCGLFRRSKKTTNCNLTMAIQSYSNSKRKMAMWTEFIDKYPTLDQWAVTVESKARA